MTKRRRVYLEGGKPLPGDVVRFEGYVLFHRDPTVYSPRVRSGDSKVLATVVGIDKRMEWALVWVVGDDQLQLGWVKIDYMRRAVCRLPRE
jgi:signal peptidase I